MMDLGDDADLFFIPDGTFTIDILHFITLVFFQNIYIYED